LAICQYEKNQENRSFHLPIPQWLLLAVLPVATSKYAQLTTDHRSEKSLAALMR
jgi:hypothetical protein